MEPKRNPSPLLYQDGLVVGNVTDKSKVRGIGALLVKRFDASLAQLLEETNPTAIHEVGCGEGRNLSQSLSPYIQQGLPVQASDVSRDLIQAHKQSSLAKKVQFKCRSIYDLIPAEDTADTIVCCEVLEHLEDPEKALRVLADLAARQYIFSVPNEPLWRCLNMARLKYVRDAGNTPGHLNHWSPRQFLSLLGKNDFNVHTIRRPCPWTMVRASSSPMLRQIPTKDQYF